MATCDSCGSTILFGGKRQGTLRFCNGNCAARGTLLTLSQQVPENVVRESVTRVHQGLCPKCGGAGPVDVHVHHRVWSAVFLTSWKSIPTVSCRSCGLKNQAGSLVYSLVLGWWGIPWGIVLTPVQIGHNLAGMMRGPDPLRASEKLEKAIRLTIASQAVKKQQAQKAAAPAGAGA